MVTADSILSRMGFPETERGHYVSMLRESIECQVARGLRFRSAGTWTDEGAALSHEERAKAILAFDWEIANGHAARVENIDGRPWGWSLNVSTMRRSFRVRWRRVPSWLRDRIRLRALAVRVFWDRRVLRKRNPFA